MLLSFAFMFVGATCASVADAKLTNSSAVPSRAIEPAGPTSVVSEQPEPGLSQKAVEIARRHGAVSGNFGHSGFGVTEMRKPFLRCLDDLAAHTVFFSHGDVSLPERRFSFHTLR